MTFVFKDCAISNQVPFTRFEIEELYSILGLETILIEVERKGKFNDKSGLIEVVCTFNVERIYV